MFSAARRKSQEGHTQNVMAQKPAEKRAFKFRRNKHRDRGNCKNNSKRKVISFPFFILRKAYRFLGIISSYTSYNIYIFIIINLDILI